MSLKMNETLNERYNNNDNDHITSTNILPWVGFGHWNWLGACDSGGNETGTDKISVFF